MQYREITEETGIIPTYHVEDEYESLMINPEKPSAKIFQTKIGLKTIELLKTIEKTCNHSWYRELKKRSRGYENKAALFYRGKKITYSEMFEKADRLAEAMVAYGIKAGEEIPCCLSNTPELVYIMLAANKIGAKLNLFGTHLNKTYLEKILSKTSNKLCFISDDNYEKISDVLEKNDFSKKVVISLADSLPEHPELCDEYEPELGHYYHYDNNVPILKNKYENISGFDEFVELSKYCNEEVADVGTLDTDFTVTYTSGSTRIGFPKQIKHSNRSYIIGGIYNDTNLTGSPEVPEIRGLAHIHSDSNTNLVTCISDNLIKHGTVALEPEYDKKKALDYIILNKPVHLDATTSFLVEVAKQYLIERKFHKDGTGRKLPQMLVTMAVGEKASKGEEKFINKFLREARAGSGIKLNGISLPYGPLSIGGGDCEHGGIYYTLLKGLQQAAKIVKIRKNDFGMVPVPFATVTALKPDGNGNYEECNYGEYGIIVANSITSMSGYKDDKEKTYRKVISDIHGRDWLSCDVYGYINNLGNVVVKGRMEDVIKMPDGVEFPLFRIDDVVGEDTKNIMSCTTTRVSTSIGEIPVVNIEFSPLKKKNEISILSSLEKRCKKSLPEHIAKNMVIRIIDNKNSYPLTGSGKRDVRALERMGLDNTLYINNGEIYSVNAASLLEQEEKTKVLL